MFDASEFQKLLTEADQAFFVRAQERMQAGEKTYGSFKYLDADTVEEAMQEVLDMSNYMRMTYIKLAVLKAHIAKLAAESPAVDQKGFVPMKEFLQQ